MPISPARRRAILAAHGGVCHYCGSAEATHVDHIVPRADGGSDDLGNLIAACLPCNLRKARHRLPHEAERRALIAAAGALPTPVSAKQCRVARAALNWSISDLAQAAGVNVNTVQRFETGQEKRDGTMAKIFAAFQSVGVEFPDRRTIRLPEQQAA